MLDMTIRIRTYGVVGGSALLRRLAPPILLFGGFSAPFHDREEQLLHRREQIAGGGEISGDLRNGTLARTVGRTIENAARDVLGGAHRLRENEIRHLIEVLHDE